jgi:hypothetical protein
MENENRNVLIVLEQSSSSVPFNSNQNGSPSLPPVTSVINVPVVPVVPVVPDAPVVPSVSNVYTVPSTSSASVIPSAPTVPKFHLTLEQIALQNKDLIGGADNRVKV